MTREIEATEKRWIAQAPPYAVYVEPAAIDWAEWWRRIVVKRALVGTITASAALGALLLALLWPPVYRAEVLLAPVSESGAETGGLSRQAAPLAALVGINLGAGQDKTQEHIAALRSRIAAVTFIEDKGLMPILFARAWDKENQRWKEAGAPPSAWEAFERWDEDIREVSQDRRTGLVRLALDWRDPRLAAEWANDFVAHVNERLRREAIQEATRRIEYLNRQLPRTSSLELQQAIYRLIEAETKRRMIASTREEYAFSVVDPAVPPEEWTRPKRALIVLVGLVAGLATAIMAALILGRAKRDDRPGDVS